MLTYVFFMSSASSFFTSWYRSPFVVTTWLPWYRTSFFGACKNCTSVFFSSNFMAWKRFETCIVIYSITTDLHLLGQQDGVFCYHRHCPQACTYREETKSLRLEKKEVNSTLERIKAIFTHFSRMLSLSFWSASEEILFPWLTWGKRTPLNQTQGRKRQTWKGMAVSLCVPETHVKRTGAELDIALYDKAHSFLHVSFGNREGTASLRQTTLGKHLKQVLLLGLPLRYWWLHIHTLVLLRWMWATCYIKIAHTVSKGDIIVI